MQTVLISTWLLCRLASDAIGERLAPGDDERDRGDVPGWVLITVMTAGLVTVLWALAGEQLQELFTSALAEVDGPGGTS